MNYRHHFHAGNYADVFKHVLLLQLIRAMQAKEKGFLFLDTHAGRGGYDLTETSLLPDGRAREPEFPTGVGRVWGDANASALPGGWPGQTPGGQQSATVPALADYLGLIRRFNDRRGHTGDELHFYPGSPWIARLAARAQDRLLLCELRPDDAEALDFDFAREPRVHVQAMDGYTGLKAHLPPPEKRALVLIDPPFESQAEFTQILKSLGESLRRFPSGVFAVWYPITERTRVDDFFDGLLALPLPPTLFAELNIAGDASLVRMKGCGLLVINPPWKIDGAIRAVLPELIRHLRIDAGASARCQWLVPEA